MKDKVNITYKKRRNSRAFKVWNTAYIYEAMQAALNIRYNITNAANLTNTDISELDTMVALPSSLAYHLTDALILAYESLMKEALITSGNISKIQPTLN